MSYKPTAIVGLLLISLILIKPIAEARGEHEGGGGGAAPAAMSAPQQQRAPQQEQRAFAPPQQQRAFAPPQQQRAPQQEQRAFAPPQQQRAPQQEQRAFAPPQQQRAPQQEQRAFAPPQQRAAQQEQRAPQQEQRAFAPQREQRAPQQEQRAQREQRVPQQEQRAQRMSSPRQERTAPESRMQANVRPSQRNGGNVNRARQIAKQDQKASKSRSSAKLATAKSSERPSQKNGGNANRARQIAKQDQKASKAQSSAKLAAARSGEKPSQKNGGNLNRARQIAQEDEKASKAQSSAKLAAARSSSNKSSANKRMIATAAGTKQSRGAISRASAFANPRRASAVRPGSKPQMTSARPQRLAYRKGATNIPRAGRAGAGRSGIIDPGGYIRTGGAARIDRSRMQQQLASIPNYHTNFSNNNGHRISDHSRWPSHWNPGSGGANLGYYPGYSWNGTNYPFSYYAPSGYCPTPYLFLSDCGSFWQPGMGYCDTLPYGYNQPISIGVDEVVPEYDTYGDIIGYQNETFYYDAFWDPNTQAYGYYDYRGGFHWVTFPWLNTWE